MRTSPTRFASLALVAAALAGCHGARLADDIDLELDFNPLRGPSDRLHSPYVAGARFTVYTIGVDREDREGWTVASSDESILSVLEERTGGEARVRASAPGTVSLILRDERGDEVHRARVEVLQPDRLELVAHGPLLVRRPELQPPSTDELQVLAGGSATFLVEWYADGDQLFGNEALSATSDDGVRAEPRQSYLFENREWVTLHAETPGRHEVRLFANDVLTRTITVVVVEESAIDRVELHGEDERGARDGDPLVVYAQAYAADGTPIYGVEYAWDLDGRAQEGLGDLFRYNFDSTRRRMLGAHHDDLDAFAEIQAREGFVDSTNRIGCSAAPGARGPLGASLAVLAAAALALTRRRRARATPRQRAHSQRSATRRTSGAS
ncbi:MAG: hypothetical protein KF729_35380 [Sandaracinaceae bacterium]|nr:hypothetical protein [Sandaracinaceae bacterium]